MRELGDSNVPISLSAIVPGESLQGKQHPRTRHGFRAEELADLNGRLAAADVRIDRVLCRLGNDSSPWPSVQTLVQQLPRSQIGAIDCSLELATTDDRVAANRAADALFATALLPGSTLYVEPFLDLDRTMDVCHGLLNPLCNPRPAFHVLRCMNSILASVSESLASSEQFVVHPAGSDSAQVRMLASENATLCLLLPQTKGEVSVEFPDGFRLGSTRIRLFRLSEGIASEVTPTDFKQIASEAIQAGPVLLLAEN